MQREKTPEWWEKQKGSRGIRRAQQYRLVFQFPIRERHQKVLYYRQVKKLSIRETAEATGYSSSQVCRIQSLNKTTDTD